MADLRFCTCLIKKQVDNKDLNEENHYNREFTRRSLLLLAFICGLKSNGIEMDEESPKKRNKKGIIYLSTLPRSMNVTRLREVMENFGEVGRIFLQPQKTVKKNKPAKHFTEGWVEFEKKRVAKEVALGLNNKKIECRKRSELYDFIWNIKYLSKFKWVHLSERVAYERAVRKHRMRVEIAQAKKEATDFSLKVDRNEKLKLKLRENPAVDSTTLPRLPFPQKKTEQEYTEGKKKKQKPNVDTVDVLKSLFS